jgi:hypothetical protein
MAEKIDVKNIQGILTRKTGPLPNWVWIVIGVGAVYVYKKATAPEVPAASVTTSDTAYEPEDSGYPTYAGYGGTYGGYDAGGASVDTGSIPESIELVAPEGGIPVSVEIGRGGRRHDRNPKIKKITKRIHALQEGGVTKKERPKIKKLRERRKALRG